MTQTTEATATRIYSIPATGLTHTVGDVVIEVRPHSHVGFLIQATRNGVHAPELCARRDFEYDAIKAFAAIIAQVEAEQAEVVEEPAEVEVPTAPVEIAPVVKLAPAAKGTVAKVSDPGHTALAIAHLTGRIERGGQPGQADVRLLSSLAKRYLVKLTYEEGRSDARKVVTGAEITHAGRVALARLTAEDRAAAEMAAKLAVIATIQIAA